LLADLRGELAHSGHCPVTSVFFGGGTPSLFSARTVEAVLATVADLGLLAREVEVTLEANPGTVDRGSFRQYAAAGVNRVSLGVQSFSDDALKRLGRTHRSRDVWAAIEELYQSGIARFNLDLMYGLPGQTVTEALEDVEDALGAGPEHLSHYQLTLEPNTLFHSRPPAGLPTEDMAWKAFEVCHDRLNAAGYRRYEVSAYARPGGECRHNLNYWEYGDYVGVGAGAHGKRSQPRTERIVRTRKIRNPDIYMTARPPVQEVTEVGGPDRVFEFMLNALRLTGGFDLRAFEIRTGMGADNISPALEEAEARGLVHRREPSGWRPTDLGMRFLNDLQSLFLPPIEA
jgi:putative oxygen-independent coproporphyrinogen III oxidase